MRLSTLDTAAATPGRARKPRPGERWPGSWTNMRIAEDLRSDVVAHEFVHMTGVHVHDSRGVSIPLAEVSRQRMFQQLVQLRAHAGTCESIDVKAVHLRYLGDDLRAVRGVGE